MARIVILQNKKCKTHELSPFNGRSGGSSLPLGEAIEEEGVEGMAFAGEDGKGGEDVRGVVDDFEGLSSFLLYGKGLG